MTIVSGKLQSGTISKGQSAMLMPNKTKVVVEGILADDQERTSAQSGDNVKIRLRGVEEDLLAAGHVLCDAKSPCSVCKPSVNDVFACIYSFLFSRPV